MKKFLLSFAVLTMAMSLMTACSSDDDDDALPMYSRPQTASR